MARLLLADGVSFLLASLGEEVDDLRENTATVILGQYGRIASKRSSTVTTVVDDIPDYFLSV